MDKQHLAEAHARLFLRGPQRPHVLGGWVAERVWQGGFLGVLVPPALGSCPAPWQQPTFLRDCSAGWGAGQVGRWSGSPLSQSSSMAWSAATSSSSNWLPSGRPT